MISGTNENVDQVVETFQFGKGALSTKDLGNFGEEVAVDHIISRGYEILSRNVNFACGEIDIIAKCDEVVVFVEVKTRRTELYGGAEAVTAAKLKRMRKASARWLSGLEKLKFHQVRFDVIVVRIGDRGVESIDHYEGVDHGAR